MTVIEFSTATLAPTIDPAGLLGQHEPYLLDASLDYFTEDICPHGRIEESFITALPVVVATCRPIGAELWIGTDRHHCPTCAAERLLTEVC